MGGRLPQDTDIDVALHLFAEPAAPEDFGAVLVAHTLAVLEEPRVGNIAVVGQEAAVGAVHMVGTAASVDSIEYSEGLEEEEQSVRREAGGALLRPEAKLLREVEEDIDIALEGSVDNIAGLSGTGQAELRTGFEGHIVPEEHNPLEEEQVVRRAAGLGRRLEGYNPAVAEAVPDFAKLAVPGGVVDTVVGSRSCRTLSSSCLIFKRQFERSFA